MRIGIAFEVTTADRTRLEAIAVGEREFRCAVDGHEEMELALLGSDLGNIDVKIADRIGLEGFPGRFIAFDIGQPADAVAPVATM